MSIFLDDDDLIKLTGKERPSAQIKWLKQHGFIVSINHKGKPVVAAAHVNQKLGVKASDTSAQLTEEPDFSWMQKHG